MSLALAVVRLAAVIALSNNSMPKAVPHLTDGNETALVWPTIAEARVFDSPNDAYAPDDWCNDKGPRIGVWSRDVETMPLEGGKDIRPLQGGYQSQLQLSVVGYIPVTGEKALTLEDAQTELIGNLFAQQILDVLAGYETYDYNGYFAKLVQCLEASYVEINPGELEEDKRRMIRVQVDFKVTVQGNCGGVSLVHGQPNPMWSCACELINELMKCPPDVSKRPYDSLQKYLDPNRKAYTAQSVLAPLLGIDSLILADNCPTDDCGPQPAAVLKTQLPNDSPPPPEEAPQ